LLLLLFWDRGLTGWPMALNLWSSCLSLLTIGIIGLYHHVWLGIFKFFFCWDWSWNSGLCTCKAVTLPLDSQLLSILLWLFWRWKSHKLFAWAGLKSPSFWFQSPK
jgi:hypothetical protein